MCVLIRTINQKKKKELDKTLIESAFYHRQSGTRAETCTHTRENRRKKHNKKMQKQQRNTGTETQKQKQAHTFGHAAGKRTETAEHTNT